MQYVISSFHKTDRVQRGLVVLQFGTWLLLIVDSVTIFWHKTKRFLANVRTSHRDGFIACFFVDLQFPSYRISCVGHTRFCRHSVGRCQIVSLLEKPKSIKHCVCHIHDLLALLAHRSASLSCHLVHFVLCIISRPDVSCLLHFQRSAVFTAIAAHRMDLVDLENNVRGCV